MDPAPGTDAAAVRDEFVRAIEAGDASAAEEIARAALGDGMRLADLYVDVIGPALAHVGHQWEVGRMSIADEHLATGIAYDVMRLVGPSAPIQPRRSRERVLLAALGAEGHTTGLRMVGDLAESHGFDVHFLGAAVPLNTLAPIVAKHRPEIVGLTVTMAGPSAQLERAFEEVLASGHAPRGILVGGLGVPESVRTDDRVRYAADARAAIELILELADPV